MQQKKTKPLKYLMLQALKENFGNVKAASARVGIDRGTHYLWVRSDIEYRDESMRYSIQSLSNKKIHQEKPEFENGYVYLIKCVNTTFYKIGISKINYNARLSTMQSGCPYELKFINAIHSPDYRNIERVLHFKFQSKRIRGEWFDLDDIEFGILQKYFKEKSQPQSKIEFQW